MLETKDLILDKAKYTDYEKMYQNVWSREEIAKYTIWNVTKTIEEAKNRILKTIEFQKTHNMFFVYEKVSMEPIGFAGIEVLDSNVCEEAGICLGPDYVGKGFGRQILKCLIEYAIKEFNAKEFIYTAREDNLASNNLAKSLGFCKISSKLKKENDGKVFNWIKYSLKL